MHLSRIITNYYIYFIRTAVPTTGTLSIGAIPGAGARTFLVTTQAPNTNIIPVAKVLPQTSGVAQGSAAGHRGELKFL